MFIVCFIDFRALKAKEGNNLFDRLLLNRLVFFKVTGIVLGVAGKNVEYIPALVRDEKRGNNNGNQVIYHRLPVFVAVFPIFIFLVPVSQVRQ